ncbi:MAG: hypothetical protein DI536_07260 [Archangium gephyra]|uniref:Uncharacterized protein n=1 Tax=Archangium gephyra TaxID=48 RepID=A0A2W5VJF9_9BACT|nr:MAG: hypothetical protein DI536_07260 [Archangium gephyra]
MTDALTTHAATQLVPASYAEKTMASLMQLHGELMDEKERRVDLFRRLMEREQALAELKMYVKVLEARLTPPPPVAAPVMTQPVTQVRASPPRVAPQPPPISPRGRVEGWKTW